MLVARLALGKHLARGDIQGSEQCGSAMAFVVMRYPLHISLSPKPIFIFYSWDTTRELILKTLINLFVIPSVAGESLFFNALAIPLRSNQTLKKRSCKSL